MATELFVELPLVNNQQELDAEIAHNKCCDSKYIANGCRMEFRNYWEKLWKKFKPYADKHFLTEIKNNFPQRAWEMYLCNVLLDYGFSIKSNNDGPDFIVDDKIYIECIVPQKGCKNSVPDILFNKFQEYPDNQIKLRLASAFKEKFDKYTKWQNNDKINVAFPYIIAISYGWFGYSENQKMPHMLDILFSVGDMKIDLATHSVFYEFNNLLQKEDKKFQIGYFENCKFNTVSGVLFSNGIGSGVNINNLGDDCFLVKNPYAANPIPNEIFTKFNRFDVTSNGDKRSFDIIMR